MLGAHKMDTGDPKEEQREAREERPVLEEPSAAAA